MIKNINAYQAEKLPVVLDTDAFNEVDDQFAIAYTLFSRERIDLKALYAAPFLNGRVRTPEEGMEQSYDEILHILRLCGREGAVPVYRGARTFLTSQGSSGINPAAEDLARRAMEYTADSPLYVVAIGAPTNVSSALLRHPQIADRIVVLWLGGNTLDQADAREFNLEQDILSSQVLFDSAVRLVLFPCGGVVDRLRIDVAALRQRLGSGPLADYLTHIVDQYQEKEFGDEKVIWDVAPIAWLLEEAWVPAEVVEAPVLTEACTWLKLNGRKAINCAFGVDKHAIFADLFQKLRGR